MEILTPDKHQWYNQMIQKGFAERDEAYVSVYFQGNPSEIFRKTLLAAGSKNALVLDIGCGPGKYTEMLVPGYSFVVGLDRSEKSLAFGLKHHRSPRMQFVLGDSKDLPFDNETFEVTATRLSPHRLSEMMRVLKTGGFAICMRIGEHDAFRLREMFGQKELVAKMGRYIAQGESHSRHIVEQWKQAGFVEATSNEYQYDMHCETLADLAKYLSRIPIIPEFDLENNEHMKKLEKYAKENIHPESRAIILHRHRYIIQGFKPK